MNSFWVVPIFRCDRRAISARYSSHLASSSRVARAWARSTIRLIACNASRVANVAPECLQVGLLKATVMHVTRETPLDLMGFLTEICFPAKTQADQEILTNVLLQLKVKNFSRNSPNNLNGASRGMCCSLHAFAAVVQTTPYTRCSGVSVCDAPLGPTAATDVASGSEAHTCPPTSVSFIPLISPVDAMCGPVHRSTKLPIRYTVSSSPRLAASLILCSLNGFSRKSCSASASA